MSSNCRCSQCLLENRETANGRIWSIIMHVLHQYYDEQLDEIVREIQHAFPTCGNTQMQGHLIFCRIRIQQHRIRESQRRVDPAGSVMRRLRIIGRRHYHEKTCL